MPKDPFAILKKIFRPKTVVTQQNDFYKVYRMAYSDRRLLYKQGLTIFFLILITAFIGIASYSFLSQKVIFGIVFNPWFSLAFFLLLLSLVPLVFFTFQAKHIVLFITITLLLCLLPIVRISLQGVIYWQLIIPLFVFVALNLIGIGRMKMVADNQIDFSWWQIGGSGLRYFIYAYLCLAFVFGFWIVKTGVIKQSLDWEKLFTQSVSKQMKRIIPQINLEGSVDDLLSSIIDQQLQKSSLSLQIEKNIPSVTTTITTTAGINKNKTTTTTKTKTQLIIPPDYITIIAETTAQEKTLLLVSTRNQISQLLGIPVVGKETIFGLMKNFIVTKFSTWGPVITSLLVLILCLVLWQTVNLLVSVICFFVSILSYLLLKIFLKTKFFQFKIVNLPHKILVFNEE